MIKVSKLIGEIKPFLLKPIFLNEIFFWESFYPMLVHLKLFDFDQIEND